jgi:hypothetical protein
LSHLSDRVAALLALSPTDAERADARTAQLMISWNAP